MKMQSTVVGVIPEARSAIKAGLLLAGDSLLEPVQRIQITVPIDQMGAQLPRFRDDMRYTDALTMADSVMTYRLVVKQVAAEPRCLRYLHAKTDLRPERQRHACTPVAIQGRQECLL